MIEMGANFISQRGFTYLGLMFILTVLGITLALAGTLWSFSQQREKERELLFIGNQFRQAIRMYYEKTPGVIKKYPMSLDALLNDDRYVSTQRYLRKIYKDPMTEKTSWGLLSAPDGGIMGVHSLAEKKAVKVGYFKFVDSNFTAAKSYSEWVFFYTPLPASSK